MDYTWDLSVLYRDFDDPKIESDFAALKQKCAQLQAMCRQAAQQDPDPLSTLEALCDGMEDIHSWMEPLSSFASLTLATEATNERAQQLMDRLEAFSVEISLLSSGITRYIGGLPDLEAMIRQSDKLKKVDFYLRQNREEAAHLMDPAIEEWMLRMSITGSSAFSTLRDKLDATLLVDYRGKQLPLSAVRAMAYDPDPRCARTPMKPNWPPIPRSKSPWPPASTESRAKR